MGNINSKIRKFLGYLILVCAPYLAIGLSLDNWMVAIDSSTIEPEVKYNNKVHHVKLVFVYSSSCGYCKKFAPVFKEFVNNTKVSYTAITADGGLLPGFEDAIYSPAQISILNVTAYPAVYAVNVDTNKLTMVSQGYLPLSQLHQSYESAFAYLIERNGL